MTWEFSGEAIGWRGPAPFVFVAIPENVSAEIKAIAGSVTYGWGVIPVTAQVGKTTFTTSLFPRHGIYLLPLKTVVQKAERLDVGDLVQVRLDIELKGL